MNTQHQIPRPQPSPLPPLLPRPRLLTASLMARRLRVTQRWLRAEAEAGRIPCIRAEKQLLFDSDAVERVLLARAGKEVGG